VGILVAGILLVILIALVLGDIAVVRALKGRKRDSSR
jgi:hypothetical protein